jgi:acyl-coenzyme A thioesterase PaaI-like protein
MEVDISSILEFHKKNSGTGKIFNFSLIKYEKGKLELSAEFSDMTLNPDGSVQGGMMTSMLDDVTALLLINELGGIYPASVNLHSHHHRPLFKGKVTVKGEIYNAEGKLATTLMHTIFIHEARRSM